MAMIISVEFQEFVVIVVAPIVYDGCVILLVLSLFISGAMPLLELARILRRRGQKGI
jgi:hypothetical protein